MRDEGAALTGASQPEQIVSARGITVGQAFEDRAYYLESYQRSYVWQQAQVEKLIDDLRKKFERDWQPTHDDEAYRSFPTYCLGSIVVYREGTRIYLADGQQRITTLLLLLIILYDLAQEHGDAQHEVSRLGGTIRGESRSDFAVKVAEYEPAFRSLLQRHPYNPDTLATRMIWDAGEQMAAHLPATITGEALPHFVNWLLDRVSLVEIDAGDSQRGNELFNRINDRGVRLSPVDHLKDYLRSDIPARERDDFDPQWKAMTDRLGYRDANEPMTFIRSILRSQYSDVPQKSSERERARKMLDESPHDWLVENQSEIWPRPKHGDRYLLFKSQILPRHEWYSRMLDHAKVFNADFPTLWLNQRNGLLQQFDLTLAAMVPGESRTAVEKKTNLVANFIDLFVLKQGLLGQSYSQAELDAEVDRMLPRLRQAKDVKDVARELGSASQPWFASLDEVRTLLYGQANRPFVLYFLARITAWLEQHVAERGSVADLLARPDGRRPVEIEHLVTQKPGVYLDNGMNAFEIKRLRSQIGGLVLLDGSENASFGPLSLIEKVERYAPYNWLAASLAPSKYEGRGVTRFRQFRKKSGLEAHFKPYESGQSLGALVEERSRLYEEMARRIWSPSSLGFIVGKTPAGPASATSEPVASGARGVRLSDLIRTGLLLPNESLLGNRSGQKHRVTLLANGHIQTELKTYTSLSTAEQQLWETTSSRGWKIWQVESNGERLETVRERYLRSRYAQRRPGSA
ncbi:GmrSD restriction endonuclease domain-containing protein [Kineosporia babensis]|uniref:DUF262 domain-containing protein n=1 Tax=Kineosporia babensis TaxID=499548 RepID=A0A9X1NE36_9ACTN|nr:DUF262 domain-containing protein [Kineosporia babensis]MCD5312413.1 DUF262 domain-containing protein [Kineosporia babensis]